MTSSKDSPVADPLLTLVLTCDQLLRVSRAELDAATENLSEVRETTRENIAWFRQRIEELEDEMVLDRERKFKALALVGDLERLTSLEDLMSCVENLASTLGVTISVKDAGAPLDEFIGAEGDWEIGVAAKRTKSSVPAHQLGAPVASPVSPAASDLLRTLTIDPEQLWSRPYAATQISIRRPLGYSHHGLLVGDGTVIHFTGEPAPGRERGAQVSRTSLAEFLGNQKAGNLEQSFLSRGSEPLPHLSSGVAVYRAAMRIGEPGYNFLTNNCEHFAAWAAFGAPASGQVDGFATAVPHGWAKAAAESAAFLAGYGLSVSTNAMPITIPPVLGDGQLPELPIDLGRVRWASDRRELLIRLPVWQESRRPLGPPDHPWSTFAVTDESPWMSSCPSLELDPDWHAALIGFSNALFWLDASGRWYAADPALITAIESRIEPTARIVSEMLSGPSKHVRRIGQMLGSSPTANQGQES